MLMGSEGLLMLPRESEGLRALEVSRMLPNLEWFLPMVPVVLLPEATESFLE